MGPRLHVSQAVRAAGPGVRSVLWRSEWRCDAARHDLQSISGVAASDAITVATRDAAPDGHLVIRDRTDMCVANPVGPCGRNDVTDLWLGRLSGSDGAGQVHR